MAAAGARMPGARAGSVESDAAAGRPPSNRAPGCTRPTGSANVIRLARCSLKAAPDPSGALTVHQAPQPKLAAARGGLVEASSEATAGHEAQRRLFTPNHPGVPTNHPGHAPICWSMPDSQSWRRGAVVGRRDGAVPEPPKRCHPRSVPSGSGVSGPTVNPSISECSAFRGAQKLAPRSAARVRSTWPSHSPRLGGGARIGLRAPPSKLPVVTKRPASSRGAWVLLGSGRVTLEAELSDF